MGGKKQEYYAHTNGSPDPKDWQPLKEHLQNTANLAKQFAEEAKPNDRIFAATAQTSGLLHDLGKYRQEFQQYLKKERSSGIDTYHAVYGAAAACHRLNSSATGFAIAGHHTGLHNASDLSQTQRHERWPIIEDNLQGVVRPGCGTIRQGQLLPVCDQVSRTPDVRRISPTEGG